jgi:hypothetical protein
MNTIDERCYGYEPAASQLDTLRLSLSKQMRENNELRAQIVRLEMERDLEATDINRIAEMREIIFDEYPRSQNGMIGCPTEVLACALHWMKKTRVELTRLKIFETTLCDWVANQAGGFFGNESAEEVAEKIMAPLGYFEFVPYDPPKHGKGIDADAGDMIWHVTDLFNAARTKKEGGDLNGRAAE